MKKFVAPWMPPDYEEADVHAIRALQSGTASVDQQQRALAYIINQLAGTYDLSYRPNSDHDTAFAEGKRFVGLEIVKFLNLDLRRIAQVKQETVK